MTERLVYTVLGIVLLVLTELLRWLAGAPPELCTALTGLGGVLLAGGPSVVRALPGGSGGFGRIGLLALVAVAGALALAIAGGCLPRQVTAERSIDVDVSIGPPCVATLSADGAIAGTATGPTCSRALLEYYRFRTGLDPLDKTAEPEGDAP